MKVGGRIPRNVTAICGIFRISCLMERHLMRGGSEYHLLVGFIPFGAMVEYNPISAKDLSRLHQFGPKILSGIFFLFFGHALHDILVADTEELEHMDASEIYAKRLNPKEVLTPMSGESSDSQSQMR